MAENSAISWCDHTFNPWMGCFKVSDGCKYCYASDLVTGRMGKPGLWGPPASTDRQITKGPWKEVPRWQTKAAAGEPGVLGQGKPQLVFCASLADFFEDHAGLDAVRIRAWNLIRQCPDLHFQLLTKRPENIARMLPPDWGAGWPNVWLGTSIESDEYSSRADHLREIPAMVRFISYEPALGPLQGMNLEGIHWVIYGGESGPNFRQDDRRWALDMRTWCFRHDVAFFYKQAAGKRSKTDPLLDGERVEEFPI